MKEYLVIINNEKYYLINVISSLSVAKVNILFISITLDEVFELIKNVENITDLTRFNLEN